MTRLITSLSDFPHIEAQLCKLMRAMDRALDRVDNLPREAKRERREKLSPTPKPKGRPVVIGGTSLRQMVTAALERSPNMPVREMASALGVSPKFIYEQRRRLGMLPPGPAPVERGRQRLEALLVAEPQISSSEAAARLGLNERYVRDLTSRFHKRTRG